VLSKYEDEFTYDGMMEMKYLDMVLNETLRMYPVNDTQFRKCARNFKIPNTKLVIPRDTLIVVSSHAIHHDERFYDNPSQFNPERFTDENAKKIRPFTYLPFSESIYK
jgi:cytochrome P450